MDSDGPELGRRAVRIVTFVVMAAVVFGTALVLSAKLFYDLDLAVAGSPFFRGLTPWPGDVSAPWQGEDLVPLGSVMLNSDGGMNQAGSWNIPLIGFAWWFGPFGVIPLLAGGLAVVHYSRRPPVPGSYLTRRMLAAGVALVSFGMAAALQLGCIWDGLGSCSTPEGALLFLALGGFLAFVILRGGWLLGAAAGSVIGFVMGIAGVLLVTRLGGYLPGWLVMTTAVGAAAGVVVALATSRQRRGMASG